MYWSFRHSEKYKQLLQKHNYLLHHGKEGSLEILDYKLIHEQKGKLLPVKLWAKFKQDDDSYTYRHILALISSSNILTKNQPLLIQYLPDDLSFIRIKQEN